MHLNKNFLTNYGKTFLRVSTKEEVSIRLFRVPKLILGRFAV